MTAGFPATTTFGGHAFGHNRAGGDHRVLADVYAFQDDRAHADPDIIRDPHRRASRASAAAACLHNKGASASASTRRWAGASG